MANQDLRFRRRVTTVGDQQPKKNLPVIIAVAAAAVIIVPALIYTALHPANVTSTMKQFARHMPVQIKDIGRVSIVATRTTPTPQPSATPSAAPSATPASKEKMTPAQIAHVAHLKRAHELALAAAAVHSKKLASNGQISDSSGNVDTPASGSTSMTTASTTATAPPGTVASEQQPVADATPVYAPEMVVEARFVHQAEPDYPEVAKEQNAQGTAVVFATIGPNGNVISTRIDQSTGNRLLDAAALTAARESTFQPPMINGKPATETYRLLYTFAL
ncbi:MAG TPA: energy transducer TonB [Candidatus Eremiobacteraceae bacterium]|nr:energy transducer TonB [Candidatus Eremiobacteraceae bacterium]